VHGLIPASYMILNTDNLKENSIFSIRINPEKKQLTMDFITKQFRSFFPETIIETTEFDNNFDAGTKGVWEIVEKLFTAFTIIAIIIAANGLFGLVSFTSQRRIKEIGIRKVLGANTTGLYKMMSVEIFAILIISSVLAIPSGYFQTSFIPGAYKYELHLFDCFLSVGLMLVTAMIATIYHTTKAIYSNPVESLRYE
jgi:putative ABC transport system permease protein